MQSVKRTESLLIEICLVSGCGHLLAVISVSVGANDLTQPLWILLSQIMSYTIVGQLSHLLVLYPDAQNDIFLLKCRTEQDIFVNILQITNLISNCFPEISSSCHYNNFYFLRLSIQF